MTLRKRMAAATTALIVSLLVLAGASLYGLQGISNNLEGVLEEYEEIRAIEVLNFHVAAALGNLTARQPNLSAVTTELRKAIESLELFIAIQESEEVEGSLEHQGQEATSAQSLITSLNNLIGRLGQASGSKLQLSEQKRNQLVVAINAVLADLDELIVQIDTAVNMAHHVAQKKRRKTILVTAIVSAMIVLSGVLVGVGQYHSVIRPLRQLRQGVRRTARGDLDQKMVIRGDQEFVDLADEFNRMTRELQSFYQELEKRVAVKSKQLVRSERLASVGFLAAGVAHEINNPLSIISGYSEISLKQLHQGKGEAAVKASIETFQIIRNESFRCKQIIEKLLSLSHMSEASRRVLNLATVADEVASMMKGFKKTNDRQLKLHFNPKRHLNVMANEAEMKQVLLNLTVNALESVDEQRGEVHLRGGIKGGWVEICVEDNGCGMNQETLDHVFEPFYTEKRGADEHGTGLGLSIVHAIIEDHDGKIEAQSDGPGKGSRFTVLMPVVEQKMSDDKTTRI